MQLADGSIVANRFRLNRMLGRGGMGSVWHATHLGLDIPCAVKFIEGEFAGLAEAQGRFEREAKAAAQLRSPHVVQILDHGISEGVPYIAMELLDGEDLGKRLQHVGRLSYAETAVVITQVCRALTKAHSLGIVHRDLKPDNIFLVRDDDREIAKVLDFGIAKSNATGIDGSNTKTGAMLGTPYYMSPEQAQGTKSVDYRSDLWSLAVIVFQCVTGRLPFESEALGDLLVKIIVSELPVPSRYGPVPPSFDAWWARAASRDPNQRFQSAKEFGESLSSVLGQGGLTDMMTPGAGQGAIGGPITPRAPHPSHPFGMTPGGSAMAQSVAAGGAPPQNPGMAASSPGGGPAFDVTTGAPIARTYGGAVSVPSASKKPNVGAIVGGAVVGLVAIVGVIVAVTRGHAAPDGKGGAQAAASGLSNVATQAQPQPLPSATVVKTADPAVSVVASAAPSAEPVAAKKDEPKKDDVKAESRPHHGSGTSTKVTAATPTPTPTTKPKGDVEKKGDLGF